MFKFLKSKREGCHIQFLYDSLVAALSEIKSLSEKIISSFSEIIDDGWTLSAL